MFFVLSAFPSHIPQKTFWEEWGVGIILSCVVVIVIAGAMIGMFFLDRFQQREKEFVDCNGQLVDKKKVCSITLISHESISWKKGALFIAPVPTRDGYSFEGWFYDSAFSKPYINKRVKNDLTLYPKWLKHS